MRLFGLFGRKNGLVGHREIKRMHMLLDLDGLLGSIETTEPEYMPHLLEYIEDILRRYPLLRSPEDPDIERIMKIPLSGNMLLQNRWLSLCMHLIERCCFEAMLRGGLPRASHEILMRAPDVPDVRAVYLLAEVSVTDQCDIMSNTESVGRIFDILDKGDPETKRYALRILENIAYRDGMDLLTSMGGLERFRTHIIDEDPEISSRARYLMGRVEVHLISLEKQRSILAVQSTVMDEPVKPKNKAAQGTGYYRPGRKEPRRAAPVRAQEIEVLEDMSLRKRKDAGKYEKELKAALEKEADSTYKPEDDEFVIEE